MAWSGLGMIHGGVRWNSVSRATSGAIRGTNWTALAPVLLVRERVHVRLHVAGAPGVGVVAPGPAHFAGLLQDHVVPDAGLFELDRLAEPGEPGAHDHDLEPLGHLSASAASRMLRR